MAFRCEFCDKSQPARTSPVVVVTDIRRVSYQQRMKGKKIIDPGGNGFETVKELNACAACAPKEEPSTE